MKQKPKINFSATSAIPVSAIHKELKPVISYAIPKEQYLKSGYKDDHALIEEKVVAESIQLLAREIALPQNKKLYDEANKGTTFEECLGTIAARLDIAVDGSYDAATLADVCLQALRRRKPGAVQNHHIHDPRLVNAELVETKEFLTLEEVGDQHEIKLKEADASEGPYTICRTCITSFDCIQERTCKNGTPAQQLGNTMKILKGSMN